MVRHMVPAARGCDHVLTRANKQNISNKQSLYILG